MYIGIKNCIYIQIEIYFGIVFKYKKRFFFVAYVKIYPDFYGCFPTKKLALVYKSVISINRHINMDKVKRKFTQMKSTVHAKINECHCSQTGN